MPSSAVVFSRKLLLRFLTMNSLQAPRCEPCCLGKSCTVPPIIFIIMQPSVKSYFWYTLYIKSLIMLCYFNYTSIHHMIIVQEHRHHHTVVKSYSSLSLSFPKPAHFSLHSLYNAERKHTYTIKKEQTQNLQPLRRR